ncbi:MAG: hypothetical protein RL660_2075, partial [Bacteroidota bacterium]
MQLELIFANIESIVALTEEERQIFAACLSEVKVAKRQVLLKAGEICKGSYFVNSGCLRNYKLNQKDDEHVLYFSVSGWWSGDLYSLLSGQPGDTFIDALEDSSLLFLPIEEQEKLYTLVPKFERFFRIILQRSVVANQAKSYNLMSQTAQQRYENFLVRYPDLEMRISQKHIASYIGVT